LLWRIRRKGLEGALGTLDLLLGIVGFMVLIAVFFFGGGLL